MCLIDLCVLRQRARSGGIFLRGAQEDADQDAFVGVSHPSVGALRSAGRTRHGTAAREERNSRQQVKGAIVGRVSGTRAVLIGLSFPD